MKFLEFYENRITNYQNLHSVTSYILYNFIFVIFQECCLEMYTKFLENRIRNRMRRAAGLHKTTNVYCLSALSDDNARLEIEYD